MKTNCAYQDQSAQPRCCTWTTIVRSFLIAAATLVASSSFAGAVIPGDVNQDGILDGIDANLLTGGIATGSMDFLLDVNGDGVVDNVDLDTFFYGYAAESGLPFALARIDVNFDGLNTPADYLIIRGNLATTSTNFTDGNLVVDLVIDSHDLDFYIGQGGAIPEPATCTLLAIGGVYLAIGRRRLQMRSESRLQG